MNKDTSSLCPGEDMLRELELRVTSGGSISFDEALSVAALPDEALPALAGIADRLREKVCGRRLGSCSIVSARTGACSEDCAFCAQSRHARDRVNFSPMMSAEDILEHARRVEATGANHFGIVTSGRELSEGDFNAVLRAVGLVREHTRMTPCASLGLLKGDRAERLVEAGLVRYHHNLETCRSFFPHICTTHSWEERVGTVNAAREAGLEICCGGIFNVGETWRQRVELAFELRDLDPISVPINFLDARPGTALEDRTPITKNDATRIIAIYRLVLPQTFILLAGGRTQTFEGDVGAALKSGANALLVGDLLTTTGPSAASEMAAALELGFRPDAPG